MKGSRVQISDSALKIKRLHFDATSFFLPGSFDESEKAETSAVVPFRQTDRHDTAIRKTRHSGTVADNFPAFHSNRKSIRQGDHTQHCPASNGSNTLEYKRFRHLEIRCRISRINLSTGQLQPAHGNIGREIHIPKINPEDTGTQHRLEEVDPIPLIGYNPPDRRRDVRLAGCRDAQRDRTVPNNTEYGCRGELHIVRHGNGLGIKRGADERSAARFVPGSIVVPPISDQ